MVIHLRVAPNVGVKVGVNCERDSFGTLNSPVGVFCAIEELEQLIQMVVVLVNHILGLSSNYF